MGDDNHNGTTNTVATLTYHLQCARHSLSALHAWTHSEHLYEVGNVSLSLLQMRHRKVSTLPQDLFYRWGTEKLSTLPQVQATSKWRVQVVLSRVLLLTNVPNDVEILKIGALGHIVGKWEGSKESLENLLERVYKVWK